MWDASNEINQTICIFVNINISSTKLITLYVFTVFDHRLFVFLQEFYTRGIHFPLYLDVKNMSHKGDHRLTTHGDKIDYSVEESSKDCRDLAYNCETRLRQNRFQVRVGRHLHGTRALSLFNFSQSPFIYHARYQIHRYNWLTVVVFFPVLDDFPVSVSQIHWGVQSVSDLVPDLLLHLEKIHFCQDEHEKHAVLSRERQHWLFVQT